MCRGGWLLHEDRCWWREEEIIKELINLCMWLNKTDSAPVTLFRIMKLDSDGKQQTLTASEFAENLKIILGKQNNKCDVTNEWF